MGDPPATASLLEQAEQARRSGRERDAADLWARVLAQDASNPIALNALGMQALARNDPAAEGLFARAVEADPAAAPLWMNLATARRQAGDASGERQALDGALATNQQHLMANLRLAELHDREGETDAAAFRWGGVLAIIEGLPERTPALDKVADHARERLSSQSLRVGGEIDAALAGTREATRPADRRRFDACVEAMLARRRIYRQEPHGLHFPFLPADEFFPREHFPWMAELEATAPTIRRELEALLASDDSGFAPYVEMLAGSPVNKWTPLDRNDAWSARYFWKYGVRQDALCERCPQTAAALDRMPLARMPGKGPTAFFSVLKPGARLPAHSGVSNVRAVVHLPLIVPPGCGFRVGGETREWVEHEAFAFDDTIEHEAWNESDAIRAVLIFDIWNPHLSETERAMLLELFGALGKLGNVPAALGAVAE